MSGIEFNEPTFVTAKRNVLKKTSKFENVLISLGVVKTAKNARIVLIVGIFVAIVLIIGIWISQDAPGVKYGNYDAFVKDYPELVQ